MKKILLLLLLFSTTIISSAQQGEIIYRENVALVPDTNAYITPDSCLLFWYMTAPWEYQNLYLDVDLDNVSDFWVHGSLAPPVACIFTINSRDWENPASPLGWRITPCSWQDPNNDTISMFNLWRSGHFTYPNGSAYTITSPPYDTTMMLRYGLRNGIEDSVGNVTNYYGWLEVEGHWTHTWIEYKGGYKDTLTACVTRLAYCTIPNYPLRWGQTRFDEGIEEIDELSASLHPNPTNSLVTVTSEDLSKIKVLNITGQTVLKLNCSGDNAIIDLTGQPAGIYFFNITDKQGNKCTRKIVKK